METIVKIAQPIDNTSGYKILIAPISYVLDDLFPELVSRSISSQNLSCKQDPARRPCDSPAPDLALVNHSEKNITFTQGRAESDIIRRPERNKNWIGRKVA
jgi:hypothetical protein